MADLTHFDELFPGRFLKSGGKEFKDKREPTFTISAIAMEKLEGSSGAKMKATLSFRETDLQLVLNKTNGVCIRGMFGDAVKDWVGKRITFFAATIKDNFSGDDEATITAIRVRGSPDIVADITFQAQVGRKKARFTVRCTRPRPRQQPSAPQQPTPQPDPAPSYGEPPDDLLLPGQEGYGAPNEEVAG